MRTVLAFALILALAPAVAGQSVSEGNFGASRKGTAPSTETKPAPPRSAARGYPFHGAVESTDSDSLTLRGKVKPRRIVVTPETRVTRGNAKALLSDAKAGEKVSGTVFRNEQGAEQARTVRLGGKEG